MSVYAARPRSPVSTPTPSTPPASRPLLREGASGPAVMALQRKLEQLGFSPGPIDADFGPQTQAALVAFQKSRGIPADGVVGPATWTALSKRNASPGDGFDRPAPRNPSGPVPPDPVRGPSTPSQVVIPSATPETVDAAARAPLSNGVPIYRQGDSAWGGILMGDDDTISGVGCAITSAAMAMSAMTGCRIDPSQMDRVLDQNNGYSGDSIADWTLLGKVAEPPVEVSRRDGLSPSTLDAQLAAGHPVVIAVNYSGGSDNSHWMTVTGKNPDGSYAVNDPATGTSIKMRPGPDGALVADPSTTSRAYRTTGSFVTFE